MRKIKTRTIWISVAVSFVLAIGLILAVTQTKGAWTNVIIVLLAIDFIYMTIAIQIASTRTFRYRSKAMKYPTKAFVFSKEEIDLKLKKKGYKLRNTPFGQSYLLVDKEAAFKVVLVRNCEKYFGQEEQDAPKSANKDLEKCKKFIGFEIFLDYDEDTLRKLPDFCIQGQNVFYAGFYYDEEQKQLICPNYMEPSEQFNEMYAKIQEDAGLAPSEE